MGVEGKGDDGLSYQVGQLIRILSELKMWDSAENSSSHTKLVDELEKAIDKITETVVARNSLVDTKEDDDDDGL